MPDSLDPRTRLRDIARRAMVARGLEPDFSAAVQAEVARMPADPAAAGRDLRELLWCSIDNDDSRDLDQLSVAVPAADGTVRILVAIADVASRVRPGSALDAHARLNTTSVYTVAQIFPMLPERLSTDLTSLNFAVERAAVVTDLTFAVDGALVREEVYPARVRNRAKLAYAGVAAWLEGRAAMPPALAAVPGLAENLRQQAAIAGQLQARRHQQGALSLETTQTRPVFAGDELRDLTADSPDQAKALIEDLMIAVNGATARFLAARKFASIRRVVRTPKNWDRLRILATAHGGVLPAEPDARALEQFLVTARASAPAQFADLSLSVIKLLGAGEYVVLPPGGATEGHFGLAVKDYAHSTAPNRRYPDLVTQRLLQAAVATGTPPYSTDELTAIAAHCTAQEDAARKVERQVTKSAAALLLTGREGEVFSGIVTGASPKGTWVRLAKPAAEGKLEGAPGVDVGDRVQVRLVHADVERGFLDFRRA